MRNGRSTATLQDEQRAKARRSIGYGAAAVLAASIGLGCPPIVPLLALPGLILIGRGVYELIRLRRTK
jgi:hypothetical protein